MNQIIGTEHPLFDIQLFPKMADPKKSIAKIPKHPAVGGTMLPIGCKIVLEIKMKGLFKRIPLQQAPGGIQLILGTAQALPDSLLIKEFGGRYLSGTGAEQTIGLVRRVVAI